jgi:hypothetical protein
MKLKLSVAIIASAVIACSFAEASQRGSGPPTPGSTGQLAPPKVPKFVCYVRQFGTPVPVPTQTPQVATVLVVANQSGFATAAGIRIRIIVQGKSVPAVLPALAIGGVFGVPGANNAFAVGTPCTVTPA